MFESHKVPLHRPVTSLPLITQGDPTPHVNNPYHSTLPQHFLGLFPTQPKYLFPSPFKRQAPFLPVAIQVPQLPSRTANWRDHVQLTDRPRNRIPIPRLTLHPPIPPRPFQIVSALNGDTTTSSRGTGGPSCTSIFWRSAAAVRLVGFRVRQGLGRSRSTSSEEGPQRSAGERNARVAALMVPPDGEEEE